jgi:hypothetical protein
MDTEKRPSSAGDGRHFRCLNRAIIGGHGEESPAVTAHRLPAFIAAEFPVN